jgi:hypothetical protein
MGPVGCPETLVKNYHNSFVAEITTLYPVSYISINTSTPRPPTESIGAPALPYYGKGYIKIDENWTPHPDSCLKCTYGLPPY